MVLDRGRLSELSSCRSIQVVADHPGSRFVQILPFLSLRRRFRRGYLVQVQICGKPEQRGEAKVDASAISY